MDTLFIVSGQNFPIQDGTKIIMVIKTQLSYFSILISVVCCYTDYSKICLDRPNERGNFKSFVVLEKVI